MDKDEQLKIYNALKRLLFPNEEKRFIQDLRESKFSKGLICPHCNSENVIKHGKYNGKQRYKCKECEKTFSDLTNTLLQGTHFPNKWIKFIECMIKGMSLRKTAEIVGVNWVTCFYWRHKLLKALSQLKPNSFEGIIEIDETYFLYSEKGNKKIKDRKARKRGGKSKYRGISKEQVCVLVAKDMNKHTLSEVICKGRIKKKHISKCLDDKINDEIILCTDAYKSYLSYSREKDIKHYRINGQKEEYSIRGIYHIQHVNSYHSRLKQWILRFKGVASKYLNNYLTWFQFVDGKSYEAMISKIKEMLTIPCMFPVNETYKSIRISKFSVI